VQVRWDNISIYGSTALVDLGHLFSFLILYTVGRTPWMGDQPVARPLPTHRITQTQDKHRHPCLEWDSNPRFQCSMGGKTVHALDRAATAIGRLDNGVTSAIAFVYTVTNVQVPLKRDEVMTR
jgi:hypothetical protein